jgi:small subunit ribosomal protein S24e
MKLIKEKNYPLLSRKEVVYEVEHVNSATPKNEDMKNKVAQTTKEKPELIVIKNINTTYGVGFSQVTAYIYTDEKVMKDLESKKEKKKDGK